MIKMVIIKTGDESLNECMTSLLNTSISLSKGPLKTRLKCAEFDAVVVSEKGTREETLNAIFKEIPGDLFIVGDDIRFTLKWYKWLTKNLDKADIIGFATLYPGTSIVQDHGYDFMMIDGEITLVAENRGDYIWYNPSRYCDAVCGCCMYVKRKVFDAVGKFSLDGQNRWGELIFMTEAKEKGFKIMVLNHYLEHYGKSTKVNKQLKYSTTSYTFEKDLWSRIVAAHGFDKLAKKYYVTKVSPELIELLKKPVNILVYGAGSVAARLPDYRNMDYTSGLKEEDNMKFKNKTVKHISKIDFNNYRFIIITPLDCQKEIFAKEIEPRMLPHNKVFLITKRYAYGAEDIIYDFKRLVRPTK